MRILLTGGGTGGHFYPIIAIAEAIRDLASEEKVIDPELYFMAPRPFDKKALFDHQIIYRRVPAGKMRRYFSVLNFFDWFKTGFGIVKAIIQVFFIYPDVIFSKGGYGAFPAVFAAKFLGIPVVIHESDSAPGKVNAWSSKFAKRIALSYKEASKYFDENKVAWTGNPVRKEIANPVPNGAREYLGLEPHTPTILILGGSQGAKFINDAIIDILPELVKKYQIIHQVGKKNFKEVKETADLVLAESENKTRYHVFEYLDDLAMRMSAGASNIVVSRAGSALFEIALWKLPSIIIPITESNEDHQRKNAYNYARSGACTVIEEANMTPSILKNEIDRINDNDEIRERMIAGTHEFAVPEAARKIAQEIINIALTHEK